MTASLVLRALGVAIVLVRVSQAAAPAATTRSTPAPLAEPVQQSVTILEGRDRPVIGTTAAVAHYGKDEGEEAVRTALKGSSDAELDRSPEGVLVRALSLIAMGDMEPFGDLWLDRHAADAARAFFKGPPERPAKEFGGRFVYRVDFGPTSVVEFATLAGNAPFPMYFELYRKEDIYRLVWPTQGDHAQLLGQVVLTSLREPGHANPPAPGDIALDLPVGPPSAEQTTVRLYFGVSPPDEKVLSLLKRTGRAFTTGSDRDVAALYDAASAGDVNDIFGSANGQQYVEDLRAAFRRNPEVIFVLRGTARTYIALRVPAATTRDAQDANAHSSDRSRAASSQPAESAPGIVLLRCSSAASGLFLSTASSVESFPSDILLTKSLAMPEPTDVAMALAARVEGRGR